MKALTLRLTNLMNKCPPQNNIPNQWKISYNPTALLSFSSVAFCVHLFRNFCNTFSESSLAVASTLANCDESRRSRGERTEGEKETKKKQRKRSDTKWFEGKRARLVPQGKRCLSLMATLTNAISYRNCGCDAGSFFPFGHYFISP